MFDKDKILSFTIILVGLLFITSYFLTDILFDLIWFFYLLPIFSLGTILLILTIIAIQRKKKQSIVISFLFFGLMALLVLINSELFKSKKILEARLIDDLSAINLTLRENKTFEMNLSTPFTDETYTGYYEMKNNKIIFKDKHYDNEFIPDTITIIEDKIILKFDEEGKPVTEFASYFDIKKNRIKNAP